MRNFSTIRFFYFGNTTLLAIVSILALKTLYNLLPYFRTDGYWILSDYLNQPSLLATSFKKAKELMFLKSKNFIARDYFLVVYGIFNLGLMVYFIGFMLLFHFSEIVKFPKEIFLFFNNINAKSFVWSFKDISNHVPAIVFYFFLIQFAINLIKKVKLYPRQNFLKEIV